MHISDTPTGNLLMIPFIAVKITTYQAYIPSKHAWDCTVHIAPLAMRMRNCVWEGRKLGRTAQQHGPKRI